MNRMASVTHAKRRGVRLAVRNSRKASRMALMEIHSHGVASRPEAFSDSSRILNWGRPCTVTTDPPLTESGRMEKCRCRWRRRFCTSMPASTRTSPSPTHLARYQYGPRLWNPSESVTCSSGDSAEMRGSATKGTYTRRLILSLETGNSWHQDCSVSLQ